MNRYALALFLIVFGAPAQADVSKDAGTCAAYNLVQKNKSDAQKSLNAATNKPLAQNAALDFMRRVKDNGNHKGGMILLAREGFAACQTVAVR